MRLQALRFNPGDAKLQIVSQSTMDECLLQRLVGVFVLDILPDDGDRDLILRVVGAMNDVLPAGKIRLARIDAEVAEREVVHAFLRKIQRNLIDAGDVACSDDSLLLDIAEEGDLLAHLAEQHAPCGRAEYPAGFR